MDFLAVSGVNDPDFILANDSDVVVIVGDEEALWYKLFLI